MLQIGNKAIAGYSLIEILVILVILGYAISQVPPAYDRIINRSKLNAAVREVAATLRYARTTAVTSQRQRNVEFDLSTRRFDLSGTKLSGAIPRFLDMKLITARQEGQHETKGSIQFFPDGGASGGQVWLIHHDKKFVIDIDWLTGRVEIHDGAG